MTKNGSGRVERRSKSDLEALLGIDFSFKDPSNVSGLQDASVIVRKASIEELTAWRIVVAELLAEQLEKRNHTLIVQLLSPLLALVAVAVSLLGVSVGTLIAAILVTVGFLLLACIICVNDWCAQKAAKKPRVLLDIIEHELDLRLRATSNNA